MKVGIQSIIILINNYGWGGGGGIQPIVSRSGPRASKRLATLLRGQIGRYSDRQVCESIRKMGTDCRKEEREREIHGE